LYVAALNCEIFPGAAKNDRLDAHLMCLWQRLGVARNTDPADSELTWWRSSRKNSGCASAT